MISYVQKTEGKCSHIDVYAHKTCQKYIFKCNFVKYDNHRPKNLLVLDRISKIVAVMRGQVWMEYITALYTWIGK